MLNKTPLRLVAVEETPQPEEDDADGAPIVSISDEQAITRKVPESAIIAAHESLAEKASQLRRWHKLVPAAAVAILLLVIAVALATKRKAPLAPTAAPAVAPRLLDSPPPPPPAPQQVPAAVPAAEPPPAVRAETVHVRITAAPAQAELSLDGKVVAGHRLDLDLPMDRGVHVVSASAPGYLPFNQQVSFTGDVVLDINLRRGRAPAVHAATRARPPAPETSPKAEVKAAPARPAARAEPGMNLEGPLLRPAAKPIDERNPYKP